MSRVNAKLPAVFQGLREMYGVRRWRPHQEPIDELILTILSQRNSRVVVVDLSEVRAIEGGGLGMLAYLQRWAHDHNIKLKLFNPSGMVQDRLEHTWMPSLDVASTDEVIALLDRADGGMQARS